MKTDCDLLEQAGKSPRIALHCVCCGGGDLAKSPAILMPFVAKRAFGWEPVEITAAWGLRDLRCGNAYPLCNSVRCLRCGLVFLDIRFSDSEMAALYAGYRGPEYTAQREHFEPGYARRAVVIADGATHTVQVEAFLSAHVAALPRVLDWGGDTGKNTPFRSRCSLLHIFDISAQQVMPGAVSVDKHTVATTHYDLIVLSHVLEHVPFPASTISEIAAIMARDTILYIEVPYEDLMREAQDATDLHARKRYWHEHVNFFTRDSLSALIANCGLRVVDMQSIEAEGGAKRWHLWSLACMLDAVSP